MQARRITRVTAAHERGLARDLRQWFRQLFIRAADEIATSGSFTVPSAADKHVLEVRLRGRLIAVGEAVGSLTLDHAGRKSSILDELMETKKIRLYDALRGALEWARTRAAELVVAITEQVRTMINRRINRGLEEGFGTRKIAKELRDEAPELSRVRAERIARTETHVAAETGQFETAVNSGLDLVKTWVAVEDARTRPAHAAADGQFVPDLDGLFTVGGEKLRYPGDPNGSPGNIINCRCVCIYEPRIAREVTGQ